MRERSRRRRLGRRADALVRDNRFTIAVVVPAMGAVLLVAGREGLLPSALAYNPALTVAGVLVMQLPLAAALMPILDRRAVAGLALVSGYAYAIEVVGVTTGVPYGEFTYGTALGPAVAGVPVGLPLFFVPLAANGYLAVAVSWPSIGPGARWLAGVAAVLAVDLVLDPGAVALGFWSYAGGGPYYGVPASNYLGWVLSGAVAVGVIELTVPRGRLAERLETCEFALDGLVGVAVLWGGVNAVYGNVLPVAVAVAGLVALTRVDRLELHALALRRSPD